MKKVRTPRRVPGQAVIYMNVKMLFDGSIMVEEDLPGGEHTKHVMSELGFRMLVEAKLAELKQMQRAWTDFSITEGEGRDFTKGPANDH